MEVYELQEALGEVAGALDSGVTYRGWVAVRCKDTAWVGILDSKGGGEVYLKQARRVMDEKHGTLDFHQFEHFVDNAHEHSYGRGWELGDERSSVIVRGVREIYSMQGPGEVPMPVEYVRNCERERGWVP